MSPKKIVVTLVGLVAASALNAAEPTTGRLGQLEVAKGKLARAANQTKGGPRHVLLQEERRIDGLIADLEHGRAVDPAEVDRALRRAEQGGL